jgi:glycosyltransferase involved in cell wall biosynthesis
MVAARLAGVKWRIHTFTGQVWANKVGIRRWVLKILDRILVDNATFVMADSRSQRAFLIDNKVVAPWKIGVLADGSFSGVNLERFTFDPKAREEIRTSFGVPGDAIAFIFLGRLNRDKGLVDLADAFERVAPRDNRIHLMIVGFDDGGFDQKFSVLAQRFTGRVHRADFTDHPEKYLSAGDVFCLPSYREGFGSALIEAAAIGLPAIASRIYGITDAVEDGVTGILHKPGSGREIAEAMWLLISDEHLRRKMGEAARKRVAEKFSETRITGAFLKFYQEMFAGERMAPR